MLEVLPADSYDLIPKEGGGFTIQARAPAAGAIGAGKAGRKRKRKEAAAAVPRRQRRRLHKEAVAAPAVGGDETAAAPHSAAASAPHKSNADVSGGALGPAAPSSSSPALLVADVVQEWGPLGVTQPLVLAALARLGYAAPTRVQRRALPAALQHFKDVVGAAETGSGKTLCYALPIVQRLLERRQRLGMGTRPLRPAGEDEGEGSDEEGEEGSAEGSPRLLKWHFLPALVLAPTRELAVQVAAHVSALARGSAVRAVALVGGLAAQKQERQLRGHPDVVVATPGRLGDLMRSARHSFLSRLGASLQFLVLDEADRLAEKGHFDQLQGVLAALALRSGGAGGSGADADADAAQRQASASAAAANTDPDAERIIREVEARAEARRRALMREQRLLKRHAQGKGAEDEGAAEGVGEEGVDEDDEEAGDGDAAAPHDVQRGISGRTRGIPAHLLVEAPAHFRRQTFLFSATLGFATPQSTREAALALARQQQAAAAATALADEAEVGGAPAASSAARAGSASKKAFRRALSRAQGLTPVEALMLRVGLLGKPEVIKIEREREGEGGMSKSKKVKGAVREAAGVGGEGVADTKSGAEAEGASDGASAVATTAAAAAASAGPGLCAGLPASLEVARVTCAEGTKEQALYQLLLRLPGRTLIFVNSVAGLRALAALLSALRLPVHTLHAHMQQRQRLQHLEKFRADAHGVLVATDVAARGLDIPAVDLVVHFALPAAADTFVHRCGRTARGAARGLALALIGPADQRPYLRIMTQLGIARGLPEFPAAPRFGGGGEADLRRLVTRVALARRIAAAAQALSREAQQQQWLASAAGEAGLDVDDSMARALVGAGAVRADLELAVQRARLRTAAKAAAARGSRARKAGARRGPAPGEGGGGGGDGGDADGDAQMGGEDETYESATGRGAAQPVFAVDEDARAEARERAAQRAGALAEMQREMRRLLAAERLVRGGDGGKGKSKGKGLGAGGGAVLGANRGRGLHAADGTRLGGGGAGPGAARFASLDPSLLPAPGAAGTGKIKGAGKGGALALHPLQNLLRVEAPIAAAPAAHAGSALVAGRVVLGAPSAAMGGGAEGLRLAAQARFVHVPGVSVGKLLKKARAVREAERKQRRGGAGGGKSRVVRSSTRE